MAEIIFAFGLVGVMLLMVVSLFPSATNALSYCDERSQAQILADQALAEASAGPAAQESPGWAYASDPDSNGRTFHLSLALYAVPNHDPAVLRRLQAWVSWSHQGQPRSYRADRYLCQSLY